MKYKILEEIIELIYTKHNELLPFLPVLRNNIESVEIINNKTIETAQIELKNNKFYIKISKVMIDDYKLNTTDLMWILAHEISHYLQKHFDPNRIKTLSPSDENIIEDMQVNSMLYHINNKQQIELMMKLNGIAYQTLLESGDLRNCYGFMLVPPNKPEHEIRKEIMGISNIETDKKEKLILLWFDNYNKGLSLEEITVRLKEIIDFTKDEDKQEQVPQEILDLEETLKGIFENSTNNKENIENEYYSSCLDEIDLNLTPEQMQNRKLNILKYSIDKVLFKNKNYSTINDDEIFFKSVVPHYGRRETAMLSVGLQPLFYYKNEITKIKENKFAAVYIDYSASADEYKKTIYLLLLKLKDKYQGPYFLFTTKIKEVTLAEIKTGKTISGGTEIDCVINHINDNGFKKALIITDGEFEPYYTKTDIDFYALLYSTKNNASAIKQSGNMKNIWYF